MNPQDEAKNLMALVQNMTVEWKPLGGENGIAIIKTGKIFLSFTPWLLPC